jgi:hypothetical protein
MAALQEALTSYSFSQLKRQEDDWAETETSVMESKLSCYYFVLCFSQGEENIVLINNVQV